MTDTYAENWYSDDASTFGDRVSAAREALEMSEDDLARRLGVNLTTIEGWEQDLSEPRANKLQMLAGVLNVSIRWLLTGEGGDIEAPTPALSEDVVGLLTELRSLRKDMAQSTERLARLEKRLNSALRAAA